MLSTSKATGLLLLLTAPLTAQTDWSTLFGRDGAESLLGMKTDAAGRIWFCGETDSPTFVSPGALQPGVAGGFDAYVACLDPHLPPAQQLVWCTHLGGSGNDRATELHVDAAGTRVTVAGFTTSTDFPVTNGAPHAGGSDAFVVTLDPTATGSNQLLWSTLIGGSGDDVASDVAVWNGLVTVVGTTESADLPTVRAAQPTLGGARDLFVSRLAPGGAALFTTYLGGSGTEGAGIWPNNPIQTRRAQIAVDSAGRTTVCSNTDSPDHPNPSGTLHGIRGSLDLTLARLDSNGQTIQSAILGGVLDEWPFDLRCDGTDRVVIAGGTRSGGFPVTGNTLIPFSGVNDGFVVHYDLTRGQIVYSTFLGAGDWDSAMNVHLEANGDFLVALQSRSAGLAGTVGAPRRLRGSTAGQPYLLRIRPKAAATELIYATWFGGSVASQMVTVLEPDHRGGVVVAGRTRTTDSPTTPNAFDRIFTGANEAWLAVHHMLPDGVQRFGQATSPCGTPTWLQMNSAPRSGNANWALETHGAPAASLGAVFVGTPNTAGLNLLGVDLFVNLPALAGVALGADANGFASLSVPLPADFVWTGNLAFQSVWSSPCGGSLLTASNAIR